MLESPKSSSDSSTASIANIKRYAPPNQRNRSLGRRKSGGGWAAAMNKHNNPSIDLAERPVMYSGNGASAWGHFRLPHQMDFLSEL